MTTENKTVPVDRTAFTAFIPKEFGASVVLNGPPALGDVVEMVCVYSDETDGYGLMFRVKQPEAPKPEPSRIILPY